MMEGEFHSLKHMHTYIPESCPEPFGWGEVSCCQMLFLDVVATPVLLLGPLMERVHLRRHEAMQLYANPGASV